MGVTLALTVHAVALILTLAYLRQRVERKLSLTGISLMTLCLVHGPALTIYVLFTGPDSYGFEVTLERVDRSATLAQLPLAVSLMFAGLLLGIEAATVLWRGAARRAIRALRGQPRGTLNRRMRLGPFGRATLWILTLAMLAVTVAEAQVSKVANYFASGETELGMILMRSEEGGTPYYAYNLLLAAVAPFLLMVAFSAASNQPRHVALRTLIPALFIAVLIGKLGTLSKAPAVIFLLQLLLFWLLWRRHRFAWRSVALVVCSAFVMFAGIVHWTIPDLDLYGVEQFLYYRVFDIPNEVLLEYFAAVPASVPHGWGTGLVPFLRGVPDSQYLPMYSAVAEVTRGTLLSTSNAMFIGDAWAEFGWAGLAIFPVIAGFVVRSIDIYAFRHGESDVSACLVAGGTYGIFTFLSTSLNTALLTGGLALLPAIAFLLDSRGRRSARSAKPATTSSPTRPAAS